MIRNWKLSCFKSILDADIDLAPLTIFAGPNSSGKSSFLQSILVLAQTLRSWNNSALVLRGEYADLGEYQDIRRGEEPVSFGFSLSAETGDFSLLQRDGSGKLVFDRGRFTGSAVPVSAHFSWELPGGAGTERSVSFEFNADMENIDAPSGAQPLSFTGGEIPGKCRWNDEAALDTRSVEIVNEFSGKIEKIEFEEANISAVRFNHFLPERVVYTEAHGGASKSRPLPLHIREGIADFQKYFTRYIKYLGPLRTPPKKCYPIHDADTEDPGPRGENMPAALIENSDTVIEFLLPAYFDNSADYPASWPAASAGCPVRLDKAPLGKMVNCWASYIGVAESIAVRKTDDNYIPTADGKYFTNVGTGVSQVAPILVLCLLAPKDSTIIIEQPELHLHPKMQSRLADFFIAASLSGRQCLIETHSEHIVNQLCYRYASQSRDEILRDRSKIYFVEKHGVVSSISGITVDKYGALSDWPEDFFDESQRADDRIIEAVAKKLETEENDV